MRHVTSILALFVLASALPGCGGRSPELRPLVLVASEEPAALASIAERFEVRTGRSVSIEPFDEERGLPKRFDLLLLPEEAAPIASASAETLATLHAWPLARAGAGAHHPDGLWTAVARREGSRLAAAVSATSDNEADARELVAFLLSDEGQTALGALEGLAPMVRPPAPGE